MCGICGKVYFSLKEKVDRSLIEEMRDVLSHRGPDDQGIYLKGNIGLGVRRLSIIDLETGHQPIHNEEKNIWIVFNGEIYNFKELRNILQKKGHFFYTQSDTEVIVHLYEEHREECVKYLRGMFAFAIWDEASHRLFLARDRLGQKPLVYFVTPSSLLFASEIKAILQDPTVPREVNLEALHYYLTYQYIPSPLTMFKGIKKLSPASFLIYTRGGNITLKNYWQLSYTPKFTLPEEELKARLWTELEEATKLRLVSDVPVGAFLSGGIDSSAVVGMMTKITGQQVKTFSIGFSEKAFSELKYARLVAQKFNTEHHEFIIKPKAIEILPKLIWYYNEPFGDSSAIPTYYVAYYTRQYVTVALNGDGGDENFGGYDRYLANKLALGVSRLPQFILKLILKLLEPLPESTARRDYLRLFKRFWRALLLPNSHRNIKWNSIFDNQEKEALYSPSLQALFKEKDVFEYQARQFEKLKSDFLDKLLYADATTYLPEDLLVKVDIATMANSLEARSPFLDHKLVEFASRIPAHLKIKGFESKYILKKTLSSLLPPAVLSRPKMGFGVPVGKWFRFELKDFIQDFLLSPKFLNRGYFNPTQIKRLLQEHLSGARDHGPKLWTLLNLELWQREFID
jgi:asparagine synthase (glutamine-hydrolysing)